METVGRVLLALVLSLVGVTLVFVWGMVCGFGMMFVGDWCAKRFPSRFVDIDTPGSPPDLRPPLCAVAGMAGLFVQGFPTFWGAFLGPPVAGIVIWSVVGVCRVVGYPSARRRAFVVGDDGTLRSLTGASLDGLYLRHRWFDEGTGYELVDAVGGVHLNRYPNHEYATQQVELLMERTGVPMLDLQFGRAMPIGIAFATMMVPQEWVGLLLPGDRRVPDDSIAWWRQLLRPRLGRLELVELPAEEVARHLDALSSALDEADLKRVEEAHKVIAAGGGPVLAGTYHAWSEFRPPELPQGAWCIYGGEEGLMVKRWRWKGSE